MKPKVISRSIGGRSVERRLRVPGRVAGPVLTQGTMSLEVERFAHLIVRQIRQPLRRPLPRADGERPS